MILIDDSFRFISSIRSDDKDAKFCNSAKTDFDNKLSAEDNTANFAVI
jgi:hypothetical protein